CYSALDTAEEWIVNVRLHRSVEQIPRLRTGRLHRRRTFPLSGICAPPAIGSHGVRQVNG
ncbi:hypothetical protein, partial [Streptomyces sp. 2R]|uniref:hypothetical protein n=1 Tax=Streptomyces sp. 2R TaxID=1883452 RepID=UPI001C52977A